MIQFNFHEKTNKLFVVYDKFTDMSAQQIFIGVSRLCVSTC